jgi:dienelactone hydrolase
VTVRSRTVVPAAALALAGCGGSGATRISVTPRTSRADAPVHIVASGLPAGKIVTIGVTSRDAGGTTWRSAAQFRVGSEGDVDLDQAHAISGSYTGVWPGGLLATMQARRTLEPYHWRRQGSSRFVARVSPGGATAGFARRLSDDRLEPQGLDVRRDGITGFFAAPARARRHAAVLAFGGSEGGLATGYLAYELAANGYPALAVAYFAQPGLPRGLYHVPLEYFVRALAWLDRQPQVDPRRVFVLGISRGSEAALSLGARYPRLVHGVIASVPSDQLLGEAWTQHGKVLPSASTFQDTRAAARIPVERIRGPIFAVCAGDDTTWPSCLYSKRLFARLHAHHHPYPDVLVDEPAAGHFVGSLIPFTLRPVPSSSLDEQAREDVWPKLLAFLRRESQ